MHYLIEAFLIALYSTFLCFLLMTVFPYLIYKKNIFLILFILGIMKHGLGYIFNLQTYYCKSHLSNRMNAISPSLTELICEGFLYIVFGLPIFYLFSSFSSYKRILVTAFFIGFLLHVLFELVGIHQYFLENYCI
jgi:hypothetical protein